MREIYLAEARTTADTMVADGDADDPTLENYPVQPVMTA